MSAATGRASQWRLRLWAGCLCAAFLLVAGGNAFMARRGKAMRQARPETYIAEAFALMDRMDVIGAFAAWEKAYQRTPDSPLVHEVLGDLHLRLAHWAEAAAAYEKALEAGSDSTGGRLNLLICFLELERYDELAERGQRFMDQGYSDPFFPRYIAQAHFRSKRYREAVPYLKSALQAFPNDRYLMSELEQCFRALGQTKNAQLMRDKIIEVERALRALKAP